MNDKPFDAVAMTREIRDAHYEQLKDCSREEVLAFYREQAKKMLSRVEAPGSESVAPRAER